MALRREGPLAVQMRPKASTPLRSLTNTEPDGTPFTNLKRSMEADARRNPATSPSWKSLTRSDLLTIRIDLAGSSLQINLAVSNAQAGLFIKSVAPGGPSSGKLLPGDQIVSVSMSIKAFSIYLMHYRSTNSRCFI